MIRPQNVQQMNWKNRLFGQSPRRETGNIPCIAPLCPPAAVSHIASAMAPRMSSSCLVCPWIVSTDLNGLACKTPLAVAVLRHRDLPDHFGCLGEERRRHGEAEDLSGFQIND
jgi:hypothetical protein